MMLEAQLKVGLFKTLLLARVFEEKKIELAGEIAQFDIGPTSCYGQEAIPVGFCFGLNKDDYILPSIRSAWAADIAKGLPLKPIAAEMYGKAGGFSKGRELSSHITCPDLGAIGGTGVLANNITVAAGIALAAQYRKTKQVAVCFMGDGASNREEFFTGLNFAALKKLPAIYVVENNLIAEFTPYEKFMPIENIADRAVAFGIPGRIVDGNDVMAVYATAQEAIRRAREGNGPTLVECKTCRVRPMSEKKSPEKGLPAEVIEEWKKKDPVKRMRDHLLESGALTNEEITALQKKYRQEVDEAFHFARESPYAPPEEVFRDVYAEGAKVE
jgi:pyruvate dehydrogenase E1 component alpha subunit